MTENQSDESQKSWQNIILMKYRIPTLSICSLTYIVKNSTSIFPFEMPVLKKRYILYFCILIDLNCELCFLVIQKVLLFNVVFEVG